LTLPKGDKGDQGVQGVPGGPVPAGGQPGKVLGYQTGYGSTWQDPATDLGLQTHAGLDSASANLVTTPSTTTRGALDGIYSTPLARKLTVHPTAGQANYTTLAAAAAAAVSGDEIFLKAATHTLGNNSSVTIPDGVTVRASKVGAVLTGVWDTTSTAIVLGNGCRVKGVTLTNTSPTGGTFGSSVPVAIGASGKTDVKIRDVKITGTFNQGVLFNGGSDLAVLDSLFDTIGLSTGSTPGDGINIYGSNGVRVRGCTFQNLAQDGVYVNASASDVSVTGNVFRNCGEGVQVRVSCVGVTITGNTFNIKATSGIPSFGVIVQTDCTDCVVSSNTFRTTAGTGTPTFAVSADTRSHRTTIADNTITGAFAKGVVVLTTGAGGTESVGCKVVGNSINGLSSFAIHVGASENYCVVKGNHLNGGSDRGINLQASYCTVSGNTVKGAGYNAIEVGGNFNAVTGNTANATVGGGVGFNITGTDNTVSSNTATTNAAQGINETGDRNIIVGNSVTGNLHATADISSTGASSKVDYNIGRYTQKGAA
jgi:parallel beta-helix repeat protein